MLLRLDRQIPFILLKTVIKKAIICTTFPIPHLPDRLHETQWQVLFTISGNNWAIFQHIHTHLDTLCQGSYCFCTVLSLHYHCMALVSALSAREPPPPPLRCYHLVFFKISYASCEIWCEIHLKRQIRAKAMDHGGESSEGRSARVWQCKRC